MNRLDDEYFFRSELEELRAPKPKTEKARHQDRERGRRYRARRPQLIKAMQRTRTQRYVQSLKGEAKEIRKAKARDRANRWYRLNRERVLQRLRIQRQAKRSEARP